MDDAQLKNNSDDGNKLEPEPNKSGTSKRKQAEWFNIDDEHNTYVYVSGLPATITEDEFIDLMKKYGIIAKKTEPGSPYNIKLYRNEDGSLKGDGLCRYVRKDSVNLALNLLDGYQFDDKHVIHCEPAKFRQKGSYDPSKKPRIDPRVRVKQKKKEEKLLSWEPKLPVELKQKKVILKNMFSPEEIFNNPSLLIDLKEDVEEKCSEIAVPKKVEIYDKHPDGVIAVTFAEPHHAQTCIGALNNRMYDNRLVTAELWDGKTKYKIKETEEESENRLEKWKQDIIKSSEDEKCAIRNVPVTQEDVEEHKSLIDDGDA